MSNSYVHNVGMADKCIRTFLGAICLAVFFLKPSMSYVIALVGVLLLATAILGTCPAYAILGFSTAGVKKRATAKRATHFLPGQKGAPSPQAKREKKAKKRSRKK